MKQACIIIPFSNFLDNDKVFPPLGPYYIKRYVEEHSDHKIDIYHGLLPINIRRYDYVGISMTTAQYQTAKQLIKYIPDNIPVILGGPHCRYYPINDMRYNYIIPADGCKSFLSILNTGMITDELDDPDQLPYRDQSFHNYQYYLDGLPTTSMMTSRGCPHTCKFCTQAQTPVRLKSITAIRQEIQECIDLGFRAIMFYDDLFCLNEKRVKEICAVIKPFNIKFRCFASAHNFTDKMAYILADAGCVEIGFGAEHVSQKILDLIDKKHCEADIHRLIKTAFDHNIRVKAFLQIGLPGEDHHTVQELERFILTYAEHPMFDYDLCIFYPYRGSDIAYNPAKYGITIHYSQEAYYKGKQGTSIASVSTEALSNEEIKIYQQKLYSYHKRWRKS